MTDRSGWRSGEVVAWTEREGPGRPPGQRERALGMALACVLGAVLVGIMSTDALCPEHRAWVEALSALALGGVVASITGLLRGWSVAPLLTMVSAGGGVAIGLIDAAHAPERGRAIAAVFAVVVLAASVLAIRYARLAKWDRALLADLKGSRSEPLPVTDLTPGPVAEPCEAVQRPRSYTPAPPSR